MVFVRLVRALYSYSPQDEEEHSVAEGDRFLILDAGSSEDWISGVRYVPGHENLQKGVGLIPAAYVEEVCPVGKAVVQYAYRKGNWDELDLEAGAALEIYDDRDSQWWVASLENEKKIGLVPSSYLSDYKTCERGGDADPGVDEKSESFACSDFTRSASLGEVSLNDRDNVDLQGSASFLIVDRTGSDKNFKEERFLCLGPDEITLMETTSDRKLVESWKYSSLTHFSIKKNKYLTLEVGDYSRTFVIGKSHASKIKQLMEKGILEAKSSNGKAPPSAAPLVSPPPAPSFAPAVPKIAMVLKSYSPESRDYVGAERGDYVAVIEDSDPEKWLVKHMSRISDPGYMPSNILKVDENISLPPKPRKDNVGSPPPGDTGAKQRRDHEQTPPPMPDPDLPPRPAAPRLKSPDVGGVADLPARPPLAPPKTTQKLKPAQVKSASDAAQTKPASGAAQTKPASDVAQTKPASGAAQTKPASGAAQTKPALDAVQKRPSDPPLPPGFRVWSDVSGTFTTVARLLEVHKNQEKIVILKNNGMKIGVPIKKLSDKDKSFVESYIRESPDVVIKQPKAASTAVKPARSDFDWAEFFINIGISRKNSKLYASRVKSELPPDFDASGLSYRVLKNVIEADDADILRILNILEAENPSPADPQPSSQSPPLCQKQGSFPGLKISSPKIPPPSVAIPPPAADPALPPLSKAPAAKESPQHPFVSHPFAKPSAASDNGAAAKSEANELNAQREKMVDGLRKKRNDTEEALKLAQKILAQAQGEVLKASIIREESKKVRAEAALKKAQDTARQALVMSIQAKEGYLRAVKSASMHTNGPQVSQQQLRPPHSGQFPQFILQPGTQAPVNWPPHPGVPHPGVPHPGVPHPGVPQAPLGAAVPEGYFPPPPTAHPPYAPPDHYRHDQVDQYFLPHPFQPNALPAPSDNMNLLTTAQPSGYPSMRPPFPQGFSPFANHPAYERSQQPPLSYLRQYKSIDNSYNLLPTTSSIHTHHASVNSSFAEMGPALNQGNFTTGGPVTSFPILPDVYRKPQNGSGVNPSGGPSL